MESATGTVSSAYEGVVHDLPAVSARGWSEDVRGAWLDALAPDVARAWSALPAERRARLDALDALVGWMRAPLEAGATLSGARTEWGALRSELLGLRPPRPQLVAWRVQALADRVRGAEGVAILDAALAGDRDGVAAARARLLLSAIGRVDLALRRALPALVAARAACGAPEAVASVLATVEVDGVEDAVWRVGLRALSRRIAGAARVANGDAVPALLSVSA
ncbi:MAG: hypothetical protein RLZZ299_3115 [Pseudomonadota bacterium]